MSYPLLEAERTWDEENRREQLSAFVKAIEKETLLPRNPSLFMQNLINVSKEALVTANMTKVQVTVEKYATKCDACACAT